MSRNSGKRPHEKLLEIMNVGDTLTPSEIDKHVGTGNYASKHVWFLGKLGFKFDIKKEGRSVLSYTMIAEPANAADIRNCVTAVKPAKPAKPAKVAKVKAKVSKQTPVAKAARKILKNKADKQADSLLAELNKKNAGEYAGGTFSVDPDWDSMDGIDVANFIR